MDSGIVTFAEGTHIDRSKSMSFKSDRVYCVAPITLGTQTSPVYDFWAVGVDCCSDGVQPDLAQGGTANPVSTCPGWNERNMHSGMRLMDSSARAFYRQAVQQAEAAHKIRAFHPLFFTWVLDGHAELDAMRHQATSQCVMWVVGYFLFQCFLVAIS